MTRLWLLTAILLALAVVACGPDCDKYCNKVQQCRGVCGAPSIDVPQCITACNDSGSNSSHTIECVIDTTCKDIAAGHCSTTGEGFACP